MRMWESWVFNGTDNQFYVMIRNHKTSRALVKFDSQATADQQARKINGYPWYRMAELFKEALRFDILTLTHDEMDLTKKVMKTVEIARNEVTKQWHISVYVDGKRYAIYPRRTKKEAEAKLKELRGIHGNAGIIAGVRQAVKQQSN